MEPRIRLFSEQKKPVNLKAEKAKRSIILNELAKLHGVELDSDVVEDIINLKRFELRTSYYPKFMATIFGLLMGIGFTLAPTFVLIDALMDNYTRKDILEMPLAYGGIWLVATLFCSIFGYIAITLFIQLIKEYKIYKKLKKRYLDVRD